MKKRLLLLISVSVAMLSSAVYANWFADIIRVLEKTSAITNGQLSSINSHEGEILKSQQNIEDLMKQVQSSVIGHSGWGDYEYHDYQTYGSGAYNWNDVIHMAASGKGNGALGDVIGQVANQYPYDQSTFNQGVSDANAQRYYALQAGTVLAARASSQLDYNKIQDQVTYQQMLQKQIEKTQDLKSAIDLSNRIQIEGNLINLEILRQTALANQQQAVNGQASVMNAFSNARFLSSK
jgi:hypothetical protein